MTTDSQGEVQKLRDELVRTLDALEAKIDVPKRVGHGIDEVKEKVGTIRSEKPAAFAVGAVSAAAAVSGLVFLGIRALTRR